MCRYAMLALTILAGGTPPPSSAPAEELSRIRQVLGDPGATPGAVRAVLTQAAKLKTDELVPPVAALLRREGLPDAVREHAATALAEIGTETSLRALAEAASDPKHPGAAEARRALGRCDWDVLPRLSGLLAADGDLPVTVYQALADRCQLRRPRASDWWSDARPEQRRKELDRFAAQLDLAAEAMAARRRLGRPRRRTDRNRFDRMTALRIDIVPAEGEPVHRYAWLAETPPQRRRGLMNVSADQLGAWGMLFVWPNRRPRTFWMKDTPVPLTVAFLDERRRILRTAAMAPKGAARTSSGVPVRYALELPSSDPAAGKLRPGDRLTITGRFR